MKKQSDRRISNRFNKVFSVYLRGTWGCDFGIARNISEGGMFIETHDPYPLGSRLNVTFSFPSVNTEMDAVAEVIHLFFINSRKPGKGGSTMVGIGIRFVDFCVEEDQLQFSVEAVQ